MRTIKVFFLNTVIFAVTNLILRALGMWFNVYISEHIGAQGMGVFSLIMNVYMFGASAAFAGAGFAATRLVAEELALGCTDGAYSAVKKCIVYCSVCSILVCGVIYFSADYIALVILKNAECETSLRILAFVFPFISASSVLRGFFNSLGKAAVTCGSDFFGNIVRIFLTVIIFTFFEPHNITSACEYLIFAMLASEVISLLILALLYRIETKKNRGIGRGTHLWYRMAKIAVPVAASGFIKSGLSSLNQMLIPKGLIKSGINSNSAISIYGLVRGMVFPVLMFPSALLSALSAVLVPETAKMYASGKNEDIRKTVSGIFRFTSGFAVISAFVLALFSADIGNALYQSTDAGLYIAYLAPLVIIMYFDETVDSVLKGIDKQISVVLINITDTILCILLVLVLIPKYGVSGYFAVLYISELVNGFLSIGVLICTLKIRLNIFDLFVVPFFAAAISYTAMIFIPCISFVLRIAGVVIIYVFLIMAENCIKRHFFSKHK